MEQDMQAVEEWEVSEAQEEQKKKCYLMIVIIGF